MYWLSLFFCIEVKLGHTNKRIKNILQKLAKLAQILGILNNTFKSALVHKSSRIQVENVLAVPILLYRSETWTHKQKDKK